MDKNLEYDVAIIGGGPAGSTTGALLKKYSPEAKVVIMEREHFPRPHVGESQLPPITQVLHEMGCWDKVEAANFPIKIGALYRWGKTDDLWRFDFLVGEEFDQKVRPGSLEGQRLQTTFHVERAIFDEILLDHAQELGCEVCEGAKVVKIETTGDRVDRIQIQGDSMPAGSDANGWIQAKHYIDASGHVGILRRALSVEVDEPTSLKNIAMWQYWESSGWKGVDGVGSGGIRIRIFSLGSGWVWFIPIAPETVSVGFVTHAEHYKKSGLTPAELYAKALKEEPNTAGLLKGASPSSELWTTKDWSFLSKRMAGENWMLVGESAGFADPILSGGMTLAMVGGREAAYIHSAMLADEHEEDWLKNWYSDSQARRISQHINFADYWYSANTHFSELKEHTAKIAEEAGLKLNPDEAFQWLGTGGFVSDDLSAPVVGTYRLGSVKSAMQIMTGLPAEWEINKCNVFTLKLEGAKVVHVPFCKEGKIERVKCYRRDKSLLPLVGLYETVYRALCRHSQAVDLMKEFMASVSHLAPHERQNVLSNILEALEGMVVEGWVSTGNEEGRPHFQVTLDETSFSMEGR
ncbi:MAG TPA: NAD(P)/FAD-dependent oxidoreductase [Fimbriimonadaceae bacterium]|jgi:flavin-dependent dehydrogenase